MKIPECSICKGEFDLFNGECFQYAFIASYNINNSNSNLINIINPDKINKLYAMKIGDNILSSYSEFTFDNCENNKIYFYLDKENNISLEYLFENITELIDFSFNDKYIIVNTLIIVKIHII